MSLCQVPLQFTILICSLSITLYHSLYSESLLSIIVRGHLLFYVLMPLIHPRLKLAKHFFSMKLLDLIFVLIGLELFSLALIRSGGRAISLVLQKLIL